MIESIQLESQELTMRPITGSDGKKLKLFKADSVNVIIGTNGAGKTRALRQIAAAMSETGEAFGCRITFEGGEVHQEQALQRMGVIFFTPIPFFVDLPSDERRFINATPVFSNTRDSTRIDFEQFQLLKDKLGIDSSPLVTMSCDEPRLLAMLSRALVRAILRTGTVPSAVSNLPVDDIRNQTDSLLKIFGQVELDRNEVSSRRNAPVRAQDLAGFIIQYIRHLIKVAHGENYLPVMTALQLASADRRDSTKVSRAFFSVALKTELNFGSKLDDKTTSDLRRYIERAKLIYSSENNWSLTETSKGIRGSVEYKNSKVLVADPDAELEGFVSVGWEGFSSGQLALFNQFTHITQHAKTMLQQGLKEVLLLIDEGDIFLHASWQRRYVELLNTLAEELRKVGMHVVQIVLTTHSPSIITDIPSRYILRLNREEKSAPREVRGFAAAPQDVLNSSFEADAIGSFAKEVLTNTAKSIKRTGGSARDRSIISLIDDPIIRREFERLLSIFGNQV